MLIAYRVIITAGRLLFQRSQVPDFKTWRPLSPYIRSTPLVRLYFDMSKNFCCYCYLSVPWLAVSPPFNYACEKLCALARLLETKLRRLC